MASGGADKFPQCPSLGGNKGKKGKKPRYVLRLPKQTTQPLVGLEPITPQTEIPAPMPHQTEVATSTPPQTQNARTIPPNTQIATPPLPQTQNVEPTCSQKQNQLPSSRASHCEPSSNASPMSVPSRLFEIPTGDEEQLSNNDTSPFNNEDPPVGSVLPMIEPCNDGFYPSRVASKAITLTIKQQFVEPWMTWGAMTEEQKDIFFQRFKKKVSWRAEHEEKIKKIFHTKASHRLSEMFKKARQINKKSDWIFDT
ncbi:uncharacterized protein LOC109792666, partial [Cajanus cajan]|uniref:uncharacterized protein LOC109792666 n=1 Tax=Cajanus cajan TaxID=3821 RepID=UPI00098DCE84